MVQYIIPIFALAALCAGWVVVQLIAQKMKTKNHFDDLDGSTCGKCNCGGVDQQCNNRSLS
jgi:hypothetical protein